MAKQQIAEALVDKMIENGRFGESVSAQSRDHYVWLTMKTPVAHIKAKLALEERGIDNRKHPIL